MSNKDLDLPTQRELLAQFRCTELSSKALNELDADMAATFKELEGGNVVDGLGERMKNAWENAIGGFENMAARYEKSVYNVRRAELVEAIEKSLFVAFAAQTRNAERASLKMFTENLKKVTSSKKDFKSGVESAKQTSLDFFKMSVGNCVLEGTKWNISDAQRQLEEHLDEHASKARAEAVRDLVDAAKKSVGVAVGEPLAVLLGEGGEGMWEKVQKVIEREARNAAETMERKMKGMKKLFLG